MVVTSLWREWVVKSMENTAFFMISAHQVVWSVIGWCSRLAGWLWDLLFWAVAYFPGVRSLFHQCQVGPDWMSHLIAACCNGAFGIRIRWKAEREKGCNKDGEQKKGTSRWRRQSPVFYVLGQSSPWSDDEDLVSSQVYKLKCPDDCGLPEKGRIFRPKSGGVYSNYSGPWMISLFFFNGVNGTDHVINILFTNLT